MISAEEEKTHTDLLRDIDGFFPTLKKYLTSKNDDNRLIQHFQSCNGMNKLFSILYSGLIRLVSNHYQLTAIAALASVAKEAEAKDIAAEKEMIRFLLLQLKQTFQNENRCSSVGWTIVGIGKVVKNLARNDANKQLLVKEGALPLLVDGLKPEYQKSATSMEKKRCMESLWWLSFDAQNRKEMMKNETLLDLVVNIYKEGPSSNPGNCFVEAEGFLFQMRENLRQEDKYRSIANKLLNEKLSKEPAASGHVMMSYQTQHRPIVKMICDFLGQNGCKMWMDIYDMADGAESALQTMAEAVEGSVVVIMCVSESYKNSPYCRAEAEYAFIRNKYIIPLKLQKGYTPDGWLGFIQGSKYFYDFTKDDRLEEKRLQLLDAVQKAFAGQAGSSTGDAKQAEPPPVQSAAPNVPPSTPRMSSSVDEKIKTWTEKDVKQWLQKFGLTGEKLEALTAEEVLYLYNLKLEAPESFHNTVRMDLELGSISSRATFNKALTELPNVASENNE